MNKIQRSLILPYSNRQLFNLVNDIEKYPEFIPACVKASILQKENNELTATLQFNKYSFNKKLTTKNTIEEGKSITMVLIDGPLHNLQGKWEFTDLKEHGCKVSLDLEFSLLNDLLGRAFMPIVHKAVGMVMTAFCERAHKLYAKK